TSVDPSPLPPSHRQGPPAAPRENWPLTSAVMALYLPQMVWVGVRFHVTFASALLRCKLCTAELVKLVCTPDRLGSGTNCCSFQAGALWRFSGMTLLGNGVRPLPSGLPVAGSKIGVPKELKSPRRCSGVATVNNPDFPRPSNEPSQSPKMKSLSLIM